MKSRSFAALVVVVGLFAVGCAEEDTPAPESQEGVVAQADEAVAEEAQVEVAAQGAGEAQRKPNEPSCFDVPWGPTICCTPQSCVVF